MSHRLLLIEHQPLPAHASVGTLLRAEAGLEYDHVTWDDFSPAYLRESPAHLVIAAAAAQPAKALSFFEWLRQHTTHIPTVAVLPEHTEAQLLRSAAEAADDFALWPLRAAELRQRLGRLLGPAGATADAVRQRLTQELGLAQLIGSAPPFVHLLEQLPLIARSAAPVLVTGETGTGKELCAHAIHHLSPRRNFPFIAVDCAAIPDHLFENELFGHARGAFTDAHRDHRGVVALAEGGTLFLDEIDALSLTAQGKLLRFLQERTYRPLGSEHLVHANVNVIAATNRNLETSVRDRLFRADLFFRLNVLRLCLPPLRERRVDIAPLAQHFLNAHHTPSATGHRTFAPGAVHKLQGYDWPGNVRELLNVVQRAAVLTDGTPIPPCRVELPGTASPSGAVFGDFRSARAGAIAAFERAYVLEVLRKHHGNVTRAAIEAGKDRRAFGRLVKKYDIDRCSL